MSAFYYNNYYYVTTAGNEDALPLLPQSKTRLHAALENGRYKEASKLIKSETEDFLIKCFENYEGYSPPSYKSSLHIIANLKNKKQAMRLCQELLDNVKDAENRERLLNATVVEEVRCGERTIRVKVAAIHIAAYTGNSEVVRLLFHEYGVDVNCNTSETLERSPQTGLTPLYWATINGHLELVQMLIDNSADVNAKCSADGVTPLCIAAEKNNSELVKLLLDNNADVSRARANDGLTPLHIAARNGGKEVAKLLLDNNADVNTSRANDGITPLHTASQSGHIELVQLFLYNNADVNARCTDDGATPLYTAAYIGDTEV